MRLIFTIFTLLFSATFLCGQTFNLQGKVTDEHGHPLPGATIALEDGKAICVSDVDGIFHFDNCGEHCVNLRVSYIGFETTDIHIEEFEKSDVVKVVLFPSVEKLEEVIIKDNYSEIRKKESTLNVEIVNDDYISRNFGGSLMQSIGRLPGVSSMDIGSGQSKPVIRGLSFNRVAVVENGIKHEGQQWGADHGLEIDQFAVEHLEVIKGPASLLYGSDAIGGIIDIQPGKPPHKNSVEGALQTVYRSNNNYIGTSGRISLRRINWFLDTRFSLVDFADFRVPADTVNIYSYLVPLISNRLRNTAGNENGQRLKFGYLSDHFNSVFYLSRLAATNGLFANAHGLEPRQVDPLVHDISIRDIQFPGQKVDHWKAINRSKYQFNSWNLELELGFQRNDRKEYNDYINHGYMPDYLPENSVFPENLERGFVKDIYAANLQSFLDLDNHKLQVSLATEFQQNNIDGYGFIIPAFRQWTGGIAIYDKWTISDSWLLHAGVRYDYGMIDIEAYRDWFSSPGVSGSEYLVRTVGQKREFQNSSWALGISYDKDHLHIKLNAGKSFRMPIAKELAANGVNYHHFSYEKGNPDLQAEKAYQIDGVVEWHQEIWAVQLSSFANYFPNYIYLNPTAEIDLLYGAGNQVFIYEQSEVFRYGGELHAHANLLKDFKLGIIGEYIYAQQLSGSKKGFTLPFSPPPGITISLQYHNSLSKKSFSNFFFMLDYKLKGAQNNIVPPEKKTPGYTTLNLSTGATIIVKDQKFQLNIGIQNMLNKRYMNHTSFYRLIDLPEPGRNINISLKVPFHFGI
jgi:iron complex outermembrane receptor protein